MTVLGIFFAIIGALIVGTIFYYVFRVSGPWGTFWSFLLVLILATLSIVAWITPFGPVYNEVPWMAILLVVIFLALLLAAASPASGRRGSYRRRTAEREPSHTGLGSTGAVAIIGIFFFILIFLLAAAALVGIFA